MPQDRRDSSARPSLEAWQTTGDRSHHRLERWDLIPIPSSQRLRIGSRSCEPLVGSGLHGTAVEGQDDRDEMGMCLEPPKYVIGLRKFEQYIFRAQPEGARSGPGDLDLVIYSLRKWMRLALAGNPTVLLPLFVPDEHLVTCTELGRQLRARADLIISREAGRRYLGYLRAQREARLGVGGGRHTNRPELEELYGFDTKYAMHMVRLGVQGVELLDTGRISLPVAEPWLTWLRKLRTGGKTKDEALEAASELEARIENLLSTSPLPAHPDRDAAGRWMIEAYLTTWEGSETEA
jgi:uncharacterized protein